MKEEKAVLGGEMSGHLFFADRYFGYDDAIYAATRLLEILSQTNQKISELLSDVPKTYATPEIRVDCDDDKKAQVVERIKAHYRNIPDVIDIDGVEFHFKTAGHWYAVPTPSRSLCFVLKRQPLKT